MSLPFADRLKSARLRAGFSLQALADKLPNKISRQAIHRYEKGEVMPDSEMLNALSEALDVRPDYFFREQHVELGEIEYRKLKRMPAKEEAKVVELTRDYLSRYLELEEILGINPEFNCPLPEDFGSVSTYEQVNEAAGLVRTHWKLGCDPLSNIAELLEDKGIKVVKLEVDLSFDGLQTWAASGKVPVIAYNATKLHKTDRIRFTLLHELAHLLLKFDDDKLSYKQKETLCHQFASAMLLPKPTITEELGAHRNRISIEELGNLKRQYGISMQAAIMRAKDCGIINEHYTSQLFFFFTHQNWRKEEPVEYIGEEESHRFDQLLHRALIEDLISLSKAAALKNLKLADFRAKNANL